jgi:aryl-alcohol dehydrogenase-like predicted oxidoreductase
LSAAGSKLASLAAQAKITTSQLALAWLLRRSPVMLPIPGTSRVDHLEENVATAAVKIDDGIFQELSKLAGKGR